MKDSAYTLAFALAMGVACALLLTGVGLATRPYRDANARAEEVRNILGVLGVPFEHTAAAQKHLETFEQTVSVESRGDLKLYIYADQGVEKAAAVPFAGPGLWGPVKGFLSLAPDMKTIRGVTFYEQEETPGLGGEIVAAWFRRQFVGKKIVDAAGNPGLRIRKPGQASDANEVDGISGATMTCTKVEAMLNAVIAEIAKEGERHER